MKMSLNEMLQRLLEPAHAASEVLCPNGQGAKKYAFDDIEGSAEEILKGTLLALPNASFLEGVDLTNKDAVLAEIQKAWVGGYVSGRTWALDKVEWFFYVGFKSLDDASLEALASHQWEEETAQQELLYVFCDLAVVLQERAARRTESMSS